MKIAIQMDAVEGLNARTDTTLALAAEAQARGHALFYYQPQTLSLHGDTLTGAGWPLTVALDAVPHFTLGEAQPLSLSGMDAVLMRQDPPFDMAYITATHLLERIHPKVRVVNDPFYVRNCPEKLFPLEFPEFMPETLISATPKDIRAFHRDMGEVVVKPLYGHGGRAVFHIGREASNLEALLELMFTHAREPVMVQRFLPEVRKEERRIILIDGAVKGVLARIPAEGDIRANMRVGGTPQKAELTPRQKQICDAVGAACSQRGLLLAGLDVIGDYLTEVNITSPTGLRQIQALYGTNLAADFWDAVEALR